MATNYRFYKLTFLNRCKNAVLRLFALIGLLFMLRTYYDGGSVFENLKLHTFDFVYEVLTNIIITITRGS